jgi:hypothetical protein
MLLEINQTWTSTGSSGGLTPVYLASACADAVLKITHSTLASTQSISLQTAGSSAGPWVNEATASFSTAVSTAAAIRVTGPFLWMRPYLHSESTGDYTFRLVAVS